MADCNDDITNHLAAYLSRSALKEYEIILACAGIFRWAESREIKEMIVCPKHRDCYGTNAGVRPRRVNIQVTKPKANRGR